MPRVKEQTARWNLTVSKEADAAVRTYLGSRRAKRGGLSKFVEEAACWRVFSRTVRDIKARNAGIEPDEIQRLVEEARREVRAARGLEKRKR